MCVHIYTHNDCQVTNSDKHMYDNTGETHMYVLYIKSRDYMKTLRQQSKS